MSRNNILGKVEERPLTSLLPTTQIENTWMGEASIVAHEGDTLEFTRTIPDKRIRLIITSPPYNLGKVYEEPKALADAVLEKIGGDHVEETQRNWRAYMCTTGPAWRWNG